MTDNVSLREFLKLELLVEQQAKTIETQNDIIQKLDKRVTHIENSLDKVGRSADNLMSILKQYNII